MSQTFKHLSNQEIEQLQAMSAAENKAHAETVALKYESIALNKRIERNDAEMSALQDNRNNFQTLMAAKYGNILQIGQHGEILASEQDIQLYQMLLQQQHNHTSLNEAVDSTDVVETEAVTED